MIIGEDFPKVDFELFGLSLVEPNALIGDLILALTALYLAYKVYQLNQDSLFFKGWFLFFIIFGISFIGGGAGHVFYKYWGIEGKYFGWFSAVFAIYFLEKGMLSLLSNEKHKKMYNYLSFTKLILIEIMILFFILFIDLEIDPQKGLLPTALSTAIGFITCLGILGWYYQKKVNNAFKWLWISVLTMIPTALLQGMKINIHPLFDRNDVSHILLFITLILYWKGIKGYSKSLVNS